LDFFTQLDRLDQVPLQNVGLSDSLFELQVEILAELFRLAYEVIVVADMRVDEKPASARCSFRFIILPDMARPTSARLWL